MIRLNCSILALTLLFEGALAQAQQTSGMEAPAAPVRLNIAPQPLTAVLHEFAHQSGLQLIFQADDINPELLSPGIVGTYQPETALSQLLESSGLKYKYINPRTVAVRPSASTALDLDGKYDASQTAIETHNETSTASADSKTWGNLVRLVQADTTTTTSDNTAKDNDKVDEPARLEEIVVTARKTRERLQDVPISVTAFSGEQLEELGAVDVKDVLMMVPGLAYEGTERGLSRYNIRGVSTIQAIPTVGIYLDDIPLTTPNEQATGIQGAFDPVFFDFERLEVLKGPQGTLYGGSAMGGAIKYVSARPNLSEQSFSVAAGGATIAHGSESYNAEAVVNLPIVSDVLAVRGGFSYRHEGGYIDNVANADVQNSLVSSTPFPAYTPLTQSSQSTLNEDDYNYGDTTAARVSLLWQPDSSLTIRPTISYQESTFANPGQFFTNLPDLRSSFRLPQDTIDRATISSLEVVKDFGGVEFTSLTAYFDREALWERDYSYLIGGFGPAFFDVNSLANYRTRNEQFSQEFRIASSGAENSRLDWTLGVFYAALDAAFDGTAFTYGFGFPGDAFFTQDYQTTLDQSAVFGDATFRVTDDLSISAGVRVFRYERSNVNTSELLGFNLSANTTSFTSEDDGVSPRVSVEYRLGEDHLLYASAAKGFRPGGGQDVGFTNLTCTPAQFAAIGYDSAPESFGSDSLWTYELGSKNEFDQGRVLLNASAYYTDWSDIQQAVAIPGCSFGFVDNAGSARLQGGEIEARVNLTPEFQIGGNVGYVDAQITEGAPGSTIRTGDSLQGVPEWTVSAYVLYRRAISEDWDFQFRADYQYRSEARRNYTHTNPIAYAGGGAWGVLPDPTEFQEGYDVAGGYVALDDGTTSFRLYVNNAFDERPLLDSNLTLGSDRSTTIRPRTIGLEVRQSF